MSDAFALGVQAALDAAQKKQTAFLAQVEMYRAFLSAMIQQQSAEMEYKVALLQMAHDKELAAYNAEAAMAKEVLKHELDLELEGIKAIAEFEKARYVQENENERAMLRARTELTLGEADVAQKDRAQQQQTLRTILSDTATQKTSVMAWAQDAGYNPEEAEIIGENISQQNLQYLPLVGIPVEHEGAPKPAKGLPGAAYPTRVKGELRPAGGREAPRSGIVIPRRISIRGGTPKQQREDRQFRFEVAKWEADLQDKAIGRELEAGRLGVSQRQVQLEEERQPGVMAATAVEIATGMDKLVNEQIDRVSSTEYIDLQTAGMDETQRTEWLKKHQRSLEALRQIRGIPGRVKTGNLRPDQGQALLTEYMGQLDPTVFNPHDVTRILEADLIHGAALRRVMSGEAVDLAVQGAADSAAKIASMPPEYHEAVQRWTPLDFIGGTIAGVAGGLGGYALFEVAKSLQGTVNQSEQFAQAADVGENAELLLSTAWRQTKGALTSEDEARIKQVAYGPPVEYLKELRSLAGTSTLAASVVPDLDAVELTTKEVFWGDPTTGTPGVAGAAGESAIATIVAAVGGQVLKWVGPRVANTKVGQWVNTKVKDAMPPSVRKHFEPPQRPYGPQPAQKSAIGEPIPAAGQHAPPTWDPQTGRFISTPPIRGGATPYTTQEIQAGIPGPLSRPALPAPSRPVPPLGVPQGSRSLLPEVLPTPRPQLARPTGNTPITPGQPGVRIHTQSRQGVRHTEFRGENPALPAPEPRLALPGRIYPGGPRVGGPSLDVPVSRFQAPARGGEAAGLPQAVRDVGRSVHRLPAPAELPIRPPIQISSQVSPRLYREVMTPEGSSASVLSRSRFIPPATTPRSPSRTGDITAEDYVLPLKVKGVPDAEGIVHPNKGHLIVDANGKIVALTESRATAHGQKEIFEIGLQARAKKAAGKPAAPPTPKPPKPKGSWGKVFDDLTDEEIISTVLSQETKAALGPKPSTAIQMAREYYKKGGEKGLEDFLNETQHEAGKPLLTDLKGFAPKPKPRTKKKIKVPKNV